MKHFILVTAFFMLFSGAKAQDSTKHFELGATLITADFFSDYSYNHNMPVIHYCNGLFFRYTKNHLALRALANYSQNSFSYNVPPTESDGFTGSEKNKLFTIGIGGQYSILNKKDWLYTFVDLSYRNISSIGITRGGFAGVNNSFTATTNGVNTALGLGFKIKIVKCIYLSPEISNTFFLGNINTTTTPLNYGNTTKYSRMLVAGSFVAQLHLTVKF
ncbi:MAG: hypothetical protein ABI448_11665 [Bacteroidia bacterium]